MKLQSSPLYNFQDKTPSGTVALTGASPVTGVGKDVADATAGVATNRIARDSLSASLTWNIKAMSLTYTARWQVSVDASTWRSLNDSNDAAGTVFATGTGSDVAVTTPLVLSCPSAALSFPHVRMTVVTGGSATGVAGHDNFAVAYNYALKDEVGE